MLIEREIKTLSPTFTAGFEEEPHEIVDLGFPQ